MRLGVLTSGGDCPGLNAVIRAVVRRAERAFGAEVIGFADAWRGVLEGDYETLTVERCRGLLPRGGTIWVRPEFSPTSSMMGSSVCGRPCSVWVSTGSS